MHPSQPVYSDAHTAKAMAQKSSGVKSGPIEAADFLFKWRTHHCFTRQMNFDHISIKE
jgi:hypothetical protein